MKFIKDNMKVIVAVVIAVFITSGVVGATVYQYQASDIKYGNTTVGAAVSDLYGTVNAQGTGMGINLKNYVGSSTGNAITCPSGKICAAMFYCSGYCGNYAGRNAGCTINANGSSSNIYVASTTTSDSYSNNIFKDVIYIDGGKTISGNVFYDSYCSASLRYDVFSN